MRTVIAPEGCKQKQAEESYINHRLPQPLPFFLSPIGVKQSSGRGRAVWQLRRWTPGGRANPNVGHGSEVPSGAGRVYAAPEPQLGLPPPFPPPLRLAAQRSVQPGPCEQPLDGSVERFLLNIFIFISILGLVLRSVSASCQRRQL